MPGALGSRHDMETVVQVFRVVGAISTSRSPASSAASNVRLTMNQEFATAVRLARLLIISHSLSVVMMQRCLRRSLGMLVMVRVRDSGMDNFSVSSRTRSWDGFVDRHLGGARTVSDGSITFGRDMNGAQGIMLRALYDNLAHV